MTKTTLAENPEALTLPVLGQSGEALRGAADKNEAAESMSPEPITPSEYLQRHGLPQIFDCLLRELGDTQPEDPWAVLAAKVALRRPPPTAFAPAPRTRPLLTVDVDSTTSCTSSALTSPTASSMPATSPPVSPTLYRGSGTAQSPMRRCADDGLAFESAIHKAPAAGTSLLAPIPAINVLILAVGSHGDVRPFVALGKALERRGHHVRIATHVIFRDFVLGQGLDFFPIAGDAEELMKFMVEHPDLITFSSQEIEAKRHQMLEIYESTYLACTTPTVGASYVPDAIIANPPVHVHTDLAERLHVPLHIMFTMPWSPTSELQHPFAGAAVAALGNEQSYTIIDQMVWLGCGPSINQFRRDVLDLPKLSGASDLVHRLKLPHTYCMSPSLVKKPKDWGEHITVAGFFFLEEAGKYDAATASPALLQFLKEGPPPVYIGFGSVVVPQPRALLDTLLKGVRQAGVRAIIHQGWAQLPGDQATGPEVLLLDSPVPHDWLFPKCCAVVHHGGAGTVAAGLRAGKPTVVVPFFGDQYFWGRVVAREQVGPSPLPASRLTSDALAAALLTCQAPDMVERAQAMGEGIRAEDGVQRGVEAFEAALPFRPGGRWACEVWETQRWYFPVGWSSALLPTDPYPFADESGQQRRHMEGFALPPGWQWEGGWSKEVVEGATDPEGFQYARMWRGTWHGSAEDRWGDVVRRRKWVRLRTPVAMTPGPLCAAPSLHSTRPTVLYVTVLEGRRLVPEGVPADLYVRMSIPRGSKVCQDQRTKVVRHTVAPTWRQTFFFACVVGDVLRLDCRAQQRFMDDRPLGCCEIPVDGVCVEEGGGYDMWARCRKDGPALHLRWVRCADRFAYGSASSCVSPASSAI